MISGQCDELRDTADKLDKTSAVSTPWIHHNLTPMMRDAADTIWELRCKLAGMVDMRERARVAEAENAKLRELCADIYEMAYHEYPSAFEATFADRMRELGVEVTE